MQLEIKRIQRTLGLTVLYVTHDQEEALILSDRIAIMHEGRLHQVGTPAEVYDRPATTFVADFVGESNMLGGVVEKAATERLTIRLRGSERRLEGREGPFAPGQAVRVMIRPRPSPSGSRLPETATTGFRRWSRIAVLGQAIRYVVRGDDLTLVARVPRKADDVALRRARAWSRRGRRAPPRSSRRRRDRRAARRGARAPGDGRDLPAAVQRRRVRAAAPRGARQRPRPRLEAVVLNAPENLYYLSGYQSLGYSPTRCSWFRSTPRPASWCATASEVTCGVAHTSRI